MESYQLRLLKTSFAELACSPDLAAEYFYSELFRRSPETRAMFKEDLAVQRRALMESLELAVERVATPDLFVAFLDDLGQRHAAYGVDPVHYRSARAALIWMLEQTLGDGFTDETRDTWEELWEQIATTMMRAGEELAAAPAAGRRKPRENERRV